MDKRDGPTNITRTITTTHCQGCRYHRSQMIRSGRDPEYQHVCMNQDVPHSDRDGTWIGRTDDTPHWCPYLQDNAPGLGSKGE